jgi:hypothetical protein
MSKKTVKILFVLLCCLFLTAFLCGCGGNTVYSFPNLIPESEAEQNPVRKLERAETPTANFMTGRGEENALFGQLEELLDITVFQKRRPSFSQSVYAVVKNSYEEALRVLNRYIKNGFTDYEKVLAIHDYLVCEISYDYELYERAHSDPGYELSEDEKMSFELTGVFLEKKAVCDGLSKAFMLLCAIEGIETAYVQGTYRHDSGSVPHAWNKVKIDGEWYGIDVTLDSFTAKVNGGRSVKVLNHGYFLRSDTAMLSYEGRHQESGAFTIPQANGEYDYYARSVNPALNNTPLTVTDRAGLISAFKAAKKTKNPRVGAIELKLDIFPPGLQNDVSVFSSVIAEAYKSVSGLSFSYTANQKNPPFMFYPGGVFVFLLYA